MDRELRILLAERAINAVMNEYCHAMDSGQHERWMNCFTADALYDVALPDGEKRTWREVELETDGVLKAAKGVGEFLKRGKSAFVPD